MNLYEARTKSLSSLMRKDIAYLAILSMLLWAIGAPALLTAAHAAQLTNVSDTITDSNNSSTAKHTVAFTATNAIYGGNTLSVSFSPAGTTPGLSEFTEVFSTASSSDFSIVGGATTYSIVSTCTAGDQATVVGNLNGGSDENFTFTICPSATTIATSSAVTVVIGSTTPLVTNPSGTGSYDIRIGGTMSNQGDTRVAILPHVTVTAAIDTTFTFTVAGMATSTTFNGITTTGSSTPTTLAYNTLVTNASSTLGQTLTVATNARNGFVVTVHENQDLTSSTGATIPLFANGGASSTPAAWIAPQNSLNAANTYAHFGVSSDDTDEGSGEFNGGPKYVGDIASTTPRAVFSNTGPADGITQNFGLAHVFYTIEVGSLQPAGRDYTNILTYVATPTF